MNSKGVSPLIGFILLLLIGMIFLSVVQTKLVPSILKDVEIKHMNKVIEEIYEMDNVITSGKRSSVNFDLGVEYPKYLFLLTPQTMACSISAEKSTISIEGLNVPASSSERIIINLNYFINPNYKLVYENSAIFKFLGDKKMISGEQKMFGKDCVNIYILNSSFRSLSTNRPVQLIFLPISVPGEKGGVYVSSAKIEFDTVYPEYWNETLKSLSSSVSYIESYDVIGNRVIVNVTNVTIRFYYVYIVKGLQMTPESSAELYKSLKEKELHPTHMVKVTFPDVSELRLNTGQSVVLGVRVLDQFYNPMNGVKVDVNVDNSAGYISKTSGYTDRNGEFYVRFDAVHPGTCHVKFSANNTNSIVYNITITTVAGGNVTTLYTINWEKNEYVVTFLPSDTQKTLEMHAYTSPTVVGVSVEFATNQPEDLVYFNPKNSTTNDTGWVSTNLTISSGIFGSGEYLKQIVAYVLSWFAGDTAIINAYKTLVWIVSDYTNFSKCVLYNTVIVNKSADDSYVTLKPTSNWLSGWSYRRPITIQENSGNTLTDYQVKIVLNSNNFDFSKAKSNGSDIRFTDSDGTTLLNYWIEKWDSDNQEAVIWVKVPSIPASGTKTIYMYYGNPIATYDSNHYGLDKVMEQLPANDGDGYTIYYEVWNMPSQLFTLTGTAMNWKEDDGVWTLNLPFSFPFYSDTYTSLYVCSNGYTGQYSGEDGSSTVDELKSRNMIAPFWADLRTDTNDYDIFVNDSYSDEFGNGVYIRWYTTFRIYFIGNGGEQNFAVVLYKNGLIRFDYGSVSDASGFFIIIMDNSPVIGISYGDNTHYTLITTNDNEQASNWNNHNSIMLWPRKKATTEPTVSVGDEEVLTFHTSGYVKSYVKDLGQNSTIYFLQWNGSLPSGTEMEFWIRASNTSFDINSTTPEWVYVGKASDGNFFDLRSSNIEGRYVQWNVSLTTTDNTKTPILDEVVVGYIPK